VPRGRDDRPAFESGLRAGVAIAGLLLAATPVVYRFARSWSLRGTVAGDSMAPLLRHGDWILVDPDAYRRRSVGRGDLVVIPDPREPSRILVKRVAAVDRDGLLNLVGDNPACSTDSRQFGPLKPEQVLGRPWARYWPPRRAGLLR
jgi:nickel-type superoxide dismutase maturation protease